MQQFLCLTFEKIRSSAFFVFFLFFRFSSSAEGVRDTFN